MLLIIGLSISLSNEVNQGLLVRSYNNTVAISGILYLFKVNFCIFFFLVDEPVSLNKHNIASTSGISKDGLCCDVRSSGPPTSIVVNKSRDMVKEDLFADEGVFLYFANLFIGVYIFIFIFICVYVFVLLHFICSKLYFLCLCCYHFFCYIIIYFV